MHSNSRIYSYLYGVGLSAARVQSKNDVGGPSGCPCGVNMKGETSKKRPRKIERQGARRSVLGALPSCGGSSGGLSQVVLRSSRNLRKLAIPGKSQCACGAAPCCTAVDVCARWTVTCRARQRDWAAEGITWAEGHMGICRSHVSLSRGHLWLLLMLYVRVVREPFRKVSGKRVRKVSGMSGFKTGHFGHGRADDTVRSCPVMSGNMSGCVR